MINTIIIGDALTKLRELETESVDCCITSPPYWALRDYKTEGIVWNAVDGCEHEWRIQRTKSKLDLKEGVSYDKMQDAVTEGIEGFCVKCNSWRGSLGWEPTFDLYIKHLVEIFTEVKRVLKKTGSLWVNLGDTYGGSKAGNDDPKNRNVNTKSFTKPKTEIPEKSLCLIPQRFQIAMVDAGWICRNTVIWKKRNCMPSSARDRFTVDFEYFFFFTRSQRYFFETQYEPLSPLTIEEIQTPYTGKARKPFDEHGVQNSSEFKRRFVEKRMPKFGGNKAEGYGPRTYSGNEWSPTGFGRIKRCVWEINTVPYSDAHFATFPPKLVLTPLLATCPEYVCKRCGKAREKILEKKGTTVMQWGERKSNPWEFCDSREMPQKVMKIPVLEDTGQFSDCGCNAGFDGGIVLDPFLGSGTVALVAMQNARNFIGIELNQSYIDMAMERLKPYLLQTRLQI